MSLLLFPKMNKKFNSVIKNYRVKGYVLFIHNLCYPTSFSYFILLCNILEQMVIFVPDIPSNDCRFKMH